MAKKKTDKKTEAPAQPVDASVNDIEVVDAKEVKAEANENPTVKRQRIANELRAKRAKELAKKEAEAKKVEEAKKSASETASNANPKKDTRKTFTDDRGLKFAFKHTAPKTINIDGKSCNTDELIEDESVMLELVYGHSNFIEQIR